MKTARGLLAGALALAFTALPGKASAARAGDASPQEAAIDSLAADTALQERHFRNMEALLESILIYHRSNIQPSFDRARLLALREREALEADHSGPKELAQARSKVEELAHSRAEAAALALALARRLKQAAAAAEEAALSLNKAQSSAMKINMPRAGLYEESMRAAMRDAMLGGGLSGEMPFFAAASGASENTGCRYDNFDDSRSSVLRALESAAVRKWPEPSFFEIRRGYAPTLPEIARERSKEAMR